MADSASRDPRAPLDPAGVSAALTALGVQVPTLVVLGETGSTNADAVEKARAGQPLPVLVNADHQSHGRGRLDRVWSEPTGSSVLMSVALRVTAPITEWGWLPLLAGVAVVRAVSHTTGLETGLKWPNDVMVGAGDDSRKLAGILAERVADDIAVVGIGLNVDQMADELAIPTATSLRVELAHASLPERTLLIATIVAEMLREVQRWNEARGDAVRCGLAADYERMCITLGRSMTVQMPGRIGPSGTAAGIAADGRLIVDSPDGLHQVSAGDIIHVRPSPRP